MGVGNLLLRLRDAADDDNEQDPEWTLLFENFTAVRYSTVTCSSRPARTMPSTAGRFGGRDCIAAR